MIPAALALCVSLMVGVADFIGGLTARRVPPLQVLCVSQSIGLVALVVVVLIRGHGLPSGTFYAWSLAAGMCSLLSLSSLYRGLAIGPMGVVAPLAMLSVVGPLAVGLAEGEPVGAVRAVGLALALAGVMTSVASPDDSAGQNGRRGQVFGLLAAVGGAGWILSIRRAGSLADPVSAAAAYRACSVTGGACLLAAGRTSLQPARLHWRTLAGLGLLEACSTALFATALTIGLLTVVPVLGSLFPLVTAFIARHVLRERLTNRERKGAAIVIGGVLLVVAGGGGG